MAQYPTAAADTIVPRQALEEVVSQIFTRCGMSASHGALLANTLVASDLRAIHSHGVIRVPDYVRKLTVEGVSPRGEPRVVGDSGGALVIDGGNSMGQIGLAFAMQRAIERAAEVNIVMAVVDNSNHAGAMDYFARMALERGMIGLCGTNALPTMAPWGGREKIVGINPLAIAIPGGSAGPFLLDIAFGETAHGKIRVYAQKGAAIPEGWAFDADGKPTTDATAALSGLIRPIGGHKGVGLGMAVGLLSTVLSSAAYGTDLGNMVDGPKAGRDGQFCIAIRCEAFTRIETLRARVDAVLSEVRSSATSEGVARLLTPGQAEAEFEAKYSRDGIPLSRQTIADVVNQATLLGVDASAMLAQAQNIEARAAQSNR